MVNLYLRGNSPHKWFDEWFAIKSKYITLRIPTCGFLEWYSHKMKGTMEKKRSDTPKIPKYLLSPINLGDRTFELIVNIIPLLWYHSQCDSPKIPLKVYERKYPHTPGVGPVGVPSICLDFCTIHYALSPVFWGPVKFTFLSGTFSFKQKINGRQDNLQNIFPGASYTCTQLPWVLALKPCLLGVFTLSGWQEIRAATYLLPPGKFRWEPALFAMLV